MSNNHKDWLKFRELQSKTQSLLREHVKLIQTGTAKPKFKWLIGACKGPALNSKSGFDITRDGRYELRGKFELFVTIDHWSNDRSRMEVYATDVLTTDSFHDLERFLKRVAYIGLSAHVDFVSAASGEMQVEFLMKTIPIELMDLDVVLLASVFHRDVFLPLMEAIELARELTAKNVVSDS